MIEDIILIVLTVMFLVSIGIIIRLLQRAIQYEEIFEFLVTDIETNIKQFQKMDASPVLGGEPEIQQAHHNMMIMSKRLDEILNRMEDATKLRLRTPPPPPRPKVI